MEHVEQATAAPGERRKRQSSRPITEKQRAVLNIIIEYIASVGYPPSLRDIAAASGLASLASVKEYLYALEAKGFLRVDSGVSRGIVVLSADG